MAGFLMCNRYSSVMTLYQSTLFLQVTGTPSVPYLLLTPLVCMQTNPVREVVEATVTTQE